MYSLLPARLSCNKGVLKEYRFLGAGLESGGRSQWGCYKKRNGGGAGLPDTPGQSDGAQPREPSRPCWSLTDVHGHRVPTRRSSLLGRQSASRLVSTPQRGGPRAPSRVWLSGSRCQQPRDSVHEGVPTEPPSGPITTYFFT